jgi:16S rRNA (adenine1518-N6/adenine1519-N6)-dimethyltransferase
MTGEIRPRKSLGQHFLRDERIARRIVASVNPGAGDLVLEIGPGEGALTKYLAETPARLLLVDIDARVVARMRESYGARAEVWQQDILEVDPRAVARAHGVQRLRVIGNIPYYITAPILFHFLDHREAVRDLTIMLQREVAQRLVAGPGSKAYGIVSVIAGVLADAELLFDVQPGSFYPRPAVTSSVVRLTMLERPRFVLRDERFFRTVVRTAFGKRRKTLRNSLRSLPGIDLGPVDPLTLARRPEELSGEELAGLANLLHMHTSAGQEPPAGGERNTA